MSPTELGPLARLAAALEHLAGTIDARALEGDAGTSWTARLLTKGPDAVAAKIAEEGAELAEAVIRESDENVASEAADVIYHIMVGLRARGVPLDAVAAKLEARQGTSGIAEKAARKPD
ncbi:MAG: phosphoribosyl-ATP diphosphatase [Hyphomonas sp.]|uniref:phosphoribosyl-ATP diphosphatase n=1 Tax=Hyphomonas sp. TaxID=87 RepID=UPI00300158C0